MKRQIHAQQIIQQHAMKYNKNQLSQYDITIATAIISLNVIKSLTHQLINIYYLSLIFTILILSVNCFTFTQKIKQTQHRNKPTMRLSQKSVTFHHQPNRNPLKRPKDLVTKLNHEISSMQDAIKLYNQAQQKSTTWKKQLNLQGNTCQLKTLTQPKLQNILLESNFMNNNSLMTQKIGESVAKNALQKRRRLYSKNSLRSSSGYEMRRNFSPDELIDRNEIYTSNKKSYDQKDNRKSNLRSSANKYQEESTQQNHHSLKQTTKTPKQFNHFPQQITKFNKLVDLSRNHRQKYSSKRQLNQTARDLPTNSLMKKSSSNSQSRVQVLVESDSQTVVKGETQSIVLENNSRFFNPIMLGTDPSMQEFGFVPIVEIKRNTFYRQRHTENIRSKIQKKASKLQKEWLKTESYRSKFNIAAENTQSTNRAGKSISKLSAIIQKVQNRRPSTSVSHQRRKLSSQETMNYNMASQRSKVICQQDWVWRNTIEARC